ncbi:MAG: class I tRNA ligase family protein, partial [Muribaculaceae bacterium]|nr:class I tRNA ligase family protein [Muribaculaceae bacterium]
MKKRPESDRWIISLLNTLIINFKEALDDYEPTKAARAINEFIGDNLSNWYVRLNRKRFWGSDNDSDKLSAYQTLYQCLETIALLMAPIAPFYSDQLYRDLTSVSGRDNKSVHLAHFPKADTAAIDKELETRMDIAQRLTSMILALRRKANIKVRQPLQAMMVPATDKKQRAEIESVKDLILTEVNVKSLQIPDDDENMLVKRVKPDFKKLGPKHGKSMKQVANAIMSLSQSQIRDLERNGSINIVLSDNTEAVVDGADVEIISEDIPGWMVANEGNLTVALDITVTPELRREGVARDLINRVQNIRKSRDYNITDRITVVIEPNELTDDAIKEYS